MVPNFSNRVIEYLLVIADFSYVNRCHNLGPISKIVHNKVGKTSVVFRLFNLEKIRECVKFLHRDWRVKKARALSTVFEKFSHSN